MLNTTRNTGGGNNYSYIGSVATTSSVTPSIVIGQRTGATAYTERMRIDSNGRVGIGVNSPQASLHVTNAGASGSLSLSGGSSHSIIKMGNKDSTGSAGPNVIRAANRAIAFGVGTDHTDPNAGTFTEYFRIHSDGNVGIGTPIPNAKLDIATTGTGTSYTTPLMLSNSYAGSGKSQFILFDGPTGGAVNGDALWQNSVGHLWISPNAASKNLKLRGGLWTSVGGIDIDSTGHVGIGTTNPSAKLHISDTTSAPMSLQSSDTESDIRYLSANGDWQAGTNNAGNGTNGNQFYIFDSAYRLSIQNGTGNVGIGTVTPTAKLQIVANGANDLSLLNNTAVTGKNWVLASENNGAFSLINRTANIRRFSLDSNNDFNFITSASTVSMLITDSGYVGIGTITPTTKLDVRGHTSVGTTAAGAYIAQSAPDGYRDSIRLNRASGNFTIGMSTTGTDLQFGAGGTLSDANTKLTITSTGTVGVGVLVPSYTLHVNGSVAGNSAYTNTSDLRLKRNIASIPGALEKITSLEGIYYNWRADQFPSFKFGHRREMGVIAQQIEKIFPEAVFKDNKGFRSVAYSMLIAPIIEAIKEMKELLLGHDEEIAALKKENAIMKSYLCAKDKKASFCKY